MEFDIWIDDYYWLCSRKLEEAERSRLLHLVRRYRVLGVLSLASFPLSIVLFVLAASFRLPDSYLTAIGCLMLVGICCYKLAVPVVNRRIAAHQEDLNLNEVWMFALPGYGPDEIEGWLETYPESFLEVSRGEQPTPQLKYHKPSLNARSPFPEHDGLLPKRVEMSPADGKIIDTRALLANEVEELSYLATHSGREEFLGACLSIVYVLSISIGGWALGQAMAGYLLSIPFIVLTIWFIVKSTDGLKLRFGLRRDLTTGFIELREIVFPGEGPVTIEILPKSRFVWTIDRIPSLKRRSTPAR